MGLTLVLYYLGNSLLPLLYKWIAIALCRVIITRLGSIYTILLCLSEDFHFDYITLNMVYSFVACLNSEKEGKATPSSPLCHMVSSLQQSRFPAHFPKTIMWTIFSDWLWLSVCPSSCFVVKMKVWWTLRWKGRNLFQERFDFIGSCLTRLH